MMKGIIGFALAVLFAVTYRGCSAPPTYRDENCSFSYKAEIYEYTEDLPNVKCDGFVNAEKLECTIDTDLGAVDQAIKEYTLENVDPYYRVFFDSQSNVWKVVFNYFDEDAEKQVVYMDEYGKRC